ncbi:hypothetical protein AVEN_106334-1 [Araneus ventricosus]|uniref:Uncharacterized protein n=1 Tax=Araneus ventricosus TaxID=182803 RepID=A0A4Y2AV80_ARAVE|nr:hypothetical protein AVEN_106334-1 [Araneus ventricosus]
MCGRWKQSNQLITEKRRVIHKYSRKHEHKSQEKTHHLQKLAAQTDCKSQIRTATARTKSAQRLITDQVAMRTRLQRDSSNSEDVKRRLSHLSNSRVFIPFLTGCDVTLNDLVNSLYLRP